MAKKKEDDVRVHQYALGAGIRRSKKFEEKGLAKFAINVGTKCAHGCLYCSSGPQLRTHKSFKATGEHPFKFGYAIIDPDMPAKVANDAARKRKRGRVMICTMVDGWCPAAQEHGLGRRSLEAVLAESDWSVRVLTKSATVLDDFDVIRRHRDRVLLSLSITGTPDKTDIMSIVEPNASSIKERMTVLRKAHRLGLRTYAMFCPLLPGIADSPKQIARLVRSAEAIGAEEVFAEPVNPRGSGLKNTEAALRAAGYAGEADAVGAVRTQRNWSQYVVKLIANIQKATRELGMIDKLRFLLYPAKLTEQDKAIIRKDDEGVIWLGE